MTTSPPALDDWSPLTVDAVQEAFANAPFRWWVCGGVRRSWRSHDDLDIGILRTEADQVPLLAGRLGPSGPPAQGKVSPWQGERLKVERGETMSGRDGSSSSWRFDLTVGSGDHTEWVYRRDEKMRRGWDATILWTADALPYLAPKVQRWCQRDVDKRAVSTYY